MKKIKTGDILSLRDELEAQLAKDRSEPPEVRRRSLFFLISDKNAYYERETLETCATRNDKSEGF